ncbi:glycosyltransferase [Alicyclobacillus fastidiosus]|uniref:Glycosyltransferase n=1 Tax=Alicyclobacillus fastidiosus TaxID=392011 RepID=A0ABY6ZPF1_9BACL|nr:glycosyltransferase [Alicyclobacillus fastidiosus]WAH43820.1 glycosyltransferase [Alicyclobacillus fastidiosus]GMA60050.1 glycosyl transferase [Alicyclobacillus fastidiosus]
MGNTKVSVLVTTYNQQEYIAEALNSVLMQEHGYPYEVIIADDCSTDNTAHIIREFQTRYPEVMRVLPTSTNVGITQNYKRGFKACTGDYVAVLEGDDYWTSRDRIRTMVEFLDRNIGCVLAFNRYTVSNMYQSYIQPWPINDAFQILTVSDLIRSNFIGNFSTCIYRNDVIKSLDDSLYNMKVYDWMFNIAVSQHGFIGYIPQVMSVYRQHPAGTWTRKSEIDKIRETIHCIDEYNKYLNYIYNYEFTDHRNRLISQARQYGYIIG